MENEIKTENPPPQGPLSSSLNKQRFPLSSLEIVFGCLIILGLIYIGYIIFFQGNNSGSVSNIEKKIRNLENISREQGEKIDKKIKEIEENLGRLESRLKAKETTGQGKPADRVTGPAPPRVEKTLLPASTGKKKIQHKVKKGETLQRIAAKYRVSQADLLQWNKRSKNKPVRPGEILTINSR